MVLYQYFFRQCTSSVSKLKQYQRILHQLAKKNSRIPPLNLEVSVRFKHQHLKTTSYTKVAMPSRASVQKSVQLSYVKFIVKKLAKKLSSEHHRHRMRTTNRLLPMGSLKRKCIKNIFQGWVKKKLRGTGRVLTKRLAELVVRRLRAHLDLPECLDPRDAREEVVRMQYLLKVARKRLGGSAMSWLDQVTTLPLDDPALQMGAVEDWVTGSFFLIWEGSVSTTAFVFTSFAKFNNYLENGWNSASLPWLLQVPVQKVNKLNHVFLCDKSFSIIHPCPSMSRRRALPRMIRQQMERRPQLWVTTA